MTPHTHTGARRILLPLRQLLTTLTEGARLAFMLRCNTARFSTGVGGLLFMALLTMLVQIAVDWAVVKGPATFYIYPALRDAAWLVMILACGLLGQWLLGVPALAVAVLTVSGLFWAELTLNSIHVLKDGRWAPDGSGDVYYLMTLWRFLILLRVMALLAPGKDAMRHCWAALLAVSCVWFFQDNFHSSEYWYESEEEEEHTAPRKAPQVMAEDILSRQFALLDRDLAAIKPGGKGRDVFVVSFGGDADLDVFMKDTLYARAVLEQRFGAQGRSLALLNNPNMLKELPLSYVNNMDRMFTYLNQQAAQAGAVQPTQPQINYPMATAANLARALKAIGAKADPKQDMLILTLSSHGAQNGELYVHFRGVPLRQISGESLRQMLDESGFRYRVVVISACYSGKFIPLLKNDDTIVITSSREDRVSYGCGADNKLTEFSRAFFRHGLQDTGSFEKAFEKAKEIISAYEAEMPLLPASEPQISVGKNIKAYLEGAESRREGKAKRGKAQR